MTRPKWCIVQQNSVEMDKVAHALEKGLIHENTKFNSIRNGVKGYDTGRLAKRNYNIAK